MCFKAQTILELCARMARSCPCTGCHAECLIEKRYRTKDLTDANSESAIFIGYCRQSAGYIFYIPSKHLVVSRRDAHFNQAYFPARVGETMLVDRNTIKTDFKSDLALPDGDSSMPLPDARQNGTIKNDTKHSQNSPKNDIESRTNDGKHLASATTTQNTFLGDTKNSNLSKSSCFGAKTPKTTPPDIENNFKLILEPDSIIRVGVRIEFAAPHIHERANKADGLSIPDALKLSY